MKNIDHYDIITGMPQLSRRLRQQRWPVYMQIVVNWFEVRLVKSRTRQQLLKLDEHQLKDIGITLKEAEIEARKSFLD